MRQEQRFRLRIIFVVIILATLPCYCSGLLLVRLARGGSAQPTETPSPSPSWTPLPSVTPIPTWTSPVDLLADPGHAQPDALRYCHAVQHLDALPTEPPTEVFTPLPIPSETPTPTATATATATNTLPPPPTFTATATDTPSPSPSATETPSPVAHCERYADRPIIGRLSCDPDF